MAWIVTLGVVSPLPVVLVCLIYFIVEVNRMGVGFKLTIGRFLGQVALWAAVAFAVAFAIVIGLTAIFNSAQGPLALIVYGPLAISCGIVVGTIRWRIREGKRLTLSS